MVLRPGALVTVAFPFTDLSAVKRRPALVLISGGDDYILCGVTSRLSRRMDAVPLVQDDLAEGRLPKASEIRPLKVFTIHGSLVRHAVGRVKRKTLVAVVEMLIAALHAGIAK